jgi:hypothetical protein
MSQVIDKIQKLRRLATSSNVHEAAAAAAAADRLIQEHGLEEAQLESEGKASGEKATLESEPVASWSGLTPGWQLSLGALLSDHYECACFRDRVRKFGDTGKTERLRIAGRPSDVATVRYMFAWLVLEIERLAHDQKPVGLSGAEIVGFRNSYRHGAVQGVISAMRSAKASAQKQATSAAIVLVNSRKAEANDVLAKAEPNLRAGRSTSRGSHGDAFSAGFRDGQNLHGRDKASLPTGGGRQLGRGTP